MLAARCPDGMMRWLRQPVWSPRWRRSRWPMAGAARSAGWVWFSVDMRADTEAAIGRMGEALQTRSAAIALARGVGIAVEPFWDTPLVPFDRSLVGRLRDAAAACGFASRDMPTGIGHDAVFLAQRVPAALLFVPCVDGISHNEVEAITPAWAAAGLHVLADAVLATAGLVR